MRNFWNKLHNFVSKYECTQKASHKRLSFVSAFLSFCLNTLIWTACFFFLGNGWVNQDSYMPWLIDMSFYWFIGWQGLYPGYIIFFIQSATMIAGSRGKHQSMPTLLSGNVWIISSHPTSLGLWAVLYRWQQASQSSLVKNLLVFVNFAYTLLILNYSCIGFMVRMSLHN